MRLSNGICHLGLEIWCLVSSFQPDQVIDHLWLLFTLDGHGAKFVHRCYILHLVLGIYRYDDMIIILSCQALQAPAEVHVVSDHGVIQLLARRSDNTHHHVTGVEPIPMSMSFFLSADRFARSCVSLSIMARALVQARSAQI